MFVKTLTLLERARKEGYAVGGFNVWNLESALALFKAGEETSSPIIFNIQEKILNQLPSGILEGLIQILGRDSKVPMAMHLDHGKTFELCIRCIGFGYQSVMNDGAELSLEENIALTKRVVEYAHPKGVSVEGQVGEVGFSWMKEKGGRKTDPLEAQEFVKRTGVDLLAISIGTESGPYEKEPNLDYALAEEILRRTSVHLVLHGSSGLSGDAIRECRRAGITHLRFGTDLHQAFFDSIRSKEKELIKSGFNPQYLLPGTIELMKNVIKEKLEHLGSVGKAN
ncbi:MAG: class II fructose-bisphosphate aldolase [Thermodesulfobacteriota bacterium]